MDKRTVICLLSAASTAFGACAASEVGEYLIPADFRGEVPPLRVMRDIPFACDLSEADGLSFDFRADDLSEFSSFSFHFGWGSNTWCSASFYPTVEGRWTRMTVRRPDDASRDWSKVTGFRLSGWRGGTNATTLAVRGIAVEPHRAVEKSADAEYKAACAATNAAALRRLAETPPSVRERRLAWAHDPNGFQGKGWEKSARLLAENGFTDLIANLVRGPTGAYRSDVVGFAPRTGGVDRLDECLAACRRHGLKLHVWVICGRLGWEGDDALRRRLEDEGRLMVSFDGKREPWLCPSHPANRKLLVDTMLELAGKGVDGVQFDYIRYPDPDYCFCDRCRHLFEESAGRTVGDWPDAVRRDPDLLGKWRRFRCAAITAPVRQVAKRLHDGTHLTEVSAAVYYDPLYDPDQVGQDWAGWCAKGYLDFVCPMTYMEDLGDYRRKLAKHARQVKGTVPRYPGIGPSVWQRDGLEVARFADQVRSVRETGLRGFAVFELDWRFEQLLPQVRAAMLPSGR